MSCMGRWWEGSVEENRLKGEGWGFQGCWEGPWFIVMLQGGGRR